MRCWLPQWVEAKGGSQTSGLPASTTKDYQVQEGNSAGGGGDSAPRHAFSLSRVLDGGGQHPERGERGFL